MKIADIPKISRLSTAEKFYSLRRCGILLLLKSVFLCLNRIRLN